MAGTVTAAGGISNMMDVAARTCAELVIELSTGNIEHLCLIILQQTARSFFPRCFT